MRGTNSKERLVAPALLNAFIVSRSFVGDRNETVSASFLTERATSGASGRIVAITSAWVISVATD